MKKREFLLQLQRELSGFPQAEVQEQLDFYREMIDDRMDEGLSEEAAVAQIGTVDEIASQIIAQMPFAKLVKEKIKPKRQLETWQIVLLAVGSPLWLSFVVSAFAVLLSLYVSLWSLVVTVWAVFASAAACALWGLAGGIILATSQNGWTGIAMIGMGIFAAGLTIFLFYGCKAATKGTVWLTRKIILGIKRCFVKKEGK